MATLKEKVMLLRGLINGEVASTGPFFATVDVTRRCNMHCLGCQYHSSKTRTPSPGDHTVKDIPFELVERLCEELPRLGTSEVFLAGEGEPFLHPRLFDIILAFKRAGCEVQLFTNGTLVNKENVLALLDSGPDVLRVSLWANSPEEYEKCYPGADPAKLQRTLDGVRLVTTRKAQRRTVLPTMILTEPVNRHNYRGIDRRIHLAQELGCDGVVFSTYNPWQEEFAADALSAEEIESLCRDLTQAKKRLESLPLDHNIDDLLLRYRLGESAWSETGCYVGWFHTRVRVDGTITPCGSCLLPLGNLNESNLEEIWNGLQMRTFRSRALTASGLASLSQHCDCDCNWCCFSRENYQVYRFFRWVAPVLGR